MGIMDNEPGVWDGSYKDLSDGCHPPVERRHQDIDDAGRTVTVCACRIHDGIVDAYFNGLVKAQDAEWLTSVFNATKWGML